MASTPYLNQIRQHIALDELPATLQQLRTLLETSPKLHEVLQQSGRFNDLLYQIRMGTLSYEQATLTKNQIRASLLDLVDEIANEAQQPEVAAELAKAVQIVNSKNGVVNSSIQAGGDVHIGDKNLSQNAEKIYNIDKIDNANFS
jgi:Effector-associated domain 11